MIAPSVPITFEEPDVLTGSPACFPLVAGALAFGWKLAQDWHANYADDTTGLPNLADYKTADPAKCRRFITFRFAQAERTIEGEKMGADGFIDRLILSGCVEGVRDAGKLSADTAFIRAVFQHPRQAAWLNVLRTECPKVPRNFAPTAHRDYGRTLLVPAWGTPDELIKRIHAHYENSWN
jgi:hypothetical protein